LAESWKQAIWYACPYALGYDFFELVAEVWRIQGLKEVELENMRRIAHANARGDYKEKYNSRVYDSAQAETDETEIEKEGTGWETLRKWRRAIEKLEEEPKGVNVRTIVTHEGDPNFTSGMLLAIGDGSGQD
jgi:hypothetical protein